jgi:diguanylate cyclase (GGDEF)-like protein
VTTTPALTPAAAPINAHLLAGFTALVVAALLLLVYFYRRRLFIIWWMGAWVLLGASMFALARPYAQAQIGWMVYGISQFLGILGSLAFVVAADAYRHRPRLRRAYGLILLPIAIWFSLSPVAGGPQMVAVPGHLLIAGGMAAAAAAHLLLLRQVRLVGASIIGAALLGLSGTNVWMAAVVREPDRAAAPYVFVGMSVMVLAAALGMQLMTFEDMTYELRRTNRRLEAAQSELRHLVITDALTGCRNRRFFDEIIARELNRHRRYKAPLSIVFIDIDRFKVINDTLGHETGDKVLRQVAAFLLRNIREADYVFRWGGDEFLVLMSCGQDEARRRATELQQEFVATAQAAGLPPGVALSVGCVEVPPETQDVASLIQLADERMYVNKKRRR